MLRHIGKLAALSQKAIFYHLLFIMLTESTDSFYLLLTPPLSHPNFGVFPLDQVAHLGVNVSKDLKLFGREIIFKLCQPMWSNYANLCDHGT